MLLNRFFRICSTYENFHFKVEKFKRIFSNNRYPSRLWDRCANSLLIMALFRVLCFVLGTYFYFT